MFSRLLVLVVSFAVVNVSNAQDKDVTWNFNERLSKAEDKISILEKQVKALRDANFLSNNPQGTVLAQTGPLTLGTSPTTAPLQPVPKKFGAATPKMQAMGFNWLDITSFVEHLANLLESEGPLAVNIVRNGLKLIQAVTDRDLSAILAQLNTFAPDMQKLVADIRAEFGLVARVGGSGIGRGVSYPTPVVTYSESGVMTGPVTRSGPVRRLFGARPVRGLFGRIFRFGGSGCSN